MKDKLIKQFLLKVKEDSHRECVSLTNVELYQRFLTAGEDFKKKLVKQAGKEHSPEMLEAIDKIINAYTDCFFELAYCYYAEGHRKGLFFSLDYVQSI